eukprot:XP_016661533.1 PREDICTED: zinc finger protein 62 homolog [Acyrthosiphon pisum]
MEPLRTTFDDSTIHSMYNDIMNGSRVLSIPLIRCDDQVFKYNGSIKQEIIDETDHHNDYRQSLQKGIKTEVERNTFDTEIKVEKEYIGFFEFKEIVSSQSNSSDFTTRMNSNLTSNCFRQTPSTDDCDKATTASNLTVQKRIHTKEDQYICDICNQMFARKTKLITHIRMHTLKNSYKCDICVKEFSKWKDAIEKML